MLPGELDAIWAVCSGEEVFTAQPDAVIFDDESRNELVDVHTSQAKQEDDHQELRGQCDDGPAPIRVVWFELRVEELPPHEFTVGIWCGADDGDQKYTISYHVWERMRQEM
jgi:hypothetical protein